MENSTLLAILVENQYANQLRSLRSSYFFMSITVFFAAVLISISLLLLFGKSPIEIFTLDFSGGKSTLYLCFFVVLYMGIFLVIEFLFLNRLRNSIDRKKEEAYRLIENCNETSALDIEKVFRRK